MASNRIVRQVLLLVSVALTLATMATASEQTTAEIPPQKGELLWHFETGG